MRYFFIFCMVILLLGCSSEETTATFELRNVDVKVENMTVKVEAEANMSSGSKIYYRIEQGEKLLQEEKFIKLNGNTWTNFKIESSLTKQPGESDDHDPPTIIIYSKDETGNMVNPNYVPVDINS